jgi:hypothetical protein
MNHCRRVLLLAYVILLFLSVPASAFPHCEFRCNCLSPCSLQCNIDFHTVITCGSWGTCQGQCFKGDSEALRSTDLGLELDVQCESVAEAESAQKRVERGAEWRVSSST